LYQVEKDQLEIWGKGGIAGRTMMIRGIMGGRPRFRLPFIGTDLPLGE
jgi:hypothetical protein